MKVAGIDCGAKYVKTLIRDEDRILAKSSVLSGFDLKASLKKSLEQALDQAGISRDELDFIAATGTGKEEAFFALSKVTEVGANARAMNVLFPSVRTVIDVGAEEGRAIRINQKGKVVDFAINEKCAAGAGTFTETMARALEIKLEEIGPLALKSQKAVPMNAQCAVFAESEVVSLIHAKHAKEDIARAVHDAISDRIASLARKIGIEKDVALVGGVARNVGFVESLKRDLQVDLAIPQDPEFSCAFGAAVAAAEKAEGG
ncbi:MAG: acyl-CoA dehydratase activase [Candidatus Aminicenantes bacterium]